MAITMTDGKTRIGRAPTPDKLTIYDKETGEAYEKFPIDAHECVASGAYSFEKEDKEVSNETSQEIVEETEGDNAEAEEGQAEKVDPLSREELEKMNKDSLIKLARSQGKAANNTMSKEKLIEIVSAPQE